MLENGQQKKANYFEVGNTLKIYNKGPNGLIWVQVRKSQHRKY